MTSGRKGQLPGETRGLGLRKLDTTLKGSNKETDFSLKIEPMIIGLLNPFRVPEAWDTRFRGLRPRLLIFDPFGVVEVQSLAIVETRPPNSRNLLLACVFKRIVASPKLVLDKSHIV